MIEEITTQIKESIETKTKVLNDQTIISKIQLMVEKSIESLNNGYFFYHFLFFILQNS
jgi:hypothetical protein